MKFLEVGVEVLPSSVCSYCPHLAAALVMQHYETLSTVDALSLLLGIGTTIGSLE